MKTIKDYGGWRINAYFRTIRNDTSVTFPISYMGPVIEYSIKTQAGELFTRGPAYDTQHRPGSRVRVRVRPDEIIVIPGNSIP